MYDIEQLEDEWKKYRRKKLKPWYISILVFLLLLVPLVLFLMNQKIEFSALKTYFKTSKETISHEEVSSNAKEKKAKSSVLVNNALDRLEIKENVIAVTDKAVKKPMNILVDIPVLEDTQDLIVSDTEIDKPKIHLDIVESTSVTAYKDVEKRFLQSREIDDALFLARSYYKKGNYKKSEYWALETNKLDENSEESLFIFVKSKVKRGHENEAISILKDYIKMSDSQEGRKLLNQIENNKL
ncbi:MAG: CDC27 family protein [Sulfurovum sp.]|uniref:tetratricopeptide repeat protein n=1 Tax=Sulfurovum sp. TaxID=1969726 RepID=UPI003C720E36